MYGLEFIDEIVIEQAKRQFLKVYPEYMPIVIGASQDKDHVIIKCHFPDGTFYFRVHYDSVSTAYRTLEDADRG